MEAFRVKVPTPPLIVVVVTGAETVITVAIRVVADLLERNLCLLLDLYLYQYTHRDSIQG
jgi:hypothetical protein